MSALLDSLCGRERLAEIARNEAAMDVEVWRPVVGYEGQYEVSSFGRVRSLDRPSKNCIVLGRLMKTPQDKSGYPRVCLRGKAWKVHHLVLCAFVGPRPAGLDCCHSDGNPGNPRLTNLRWDTRAANAADAVKHGRIPRGVDARTARLTPEQVLSIRTDSRVQARIAEEYGVTPSQISRIKSREVWAHLKEH